jgi:hypothetical protein
MLKQMPAIWRRALERRQEETEWDRCALVALDEVQDVDGTACEMQGAVAKPMAARFDEFKFVQAGAFFAPPGSRGDGPDSIDEIFAHPFGCAVPLNIAKAMIEMDRPRRARRVPGAPNPTF